MAASRCCESPKLNRWYHLNLSAGGASRFSLAAVSCACISRLKKATRCPCRASRVPSHIAHSDFRLPADPNARHRPLRGTYGSNSQAPRSALNVSHDIGSNSASDTRSTTTRSSTPSPALKWSAASFPFAAWYTFRPRA